MASWLPWGFAGYVFLGLLAAPTRHHEVFPFFCWFLFPLTPAVETRYQIRLNENAGVAAASVPFERGTGLVDARSTDAQFVIQWFGDAVARGDATEIESSRRLFEARFLRSPCRYELWRRRYDPLRSLAGEADAEAERLAVFRCDTLDEVPTRR